MELIPQPLWPWHWLTSAVVALAALALLVRWGVDLARRAEGGVTRTAALVLSLLAGLGWVAAAWNPLLRWGVHPDHSHLVVVVDVSDSMLRSEADWAGLSRMVQQTAAQAVNDLPAGILASGTASIVTFRTSTAVRPGDLALADLPAALAQLGPADFAFGDGTNLSAALGQAGQLIQSAGGTGAILLVTDGQETEGEAAATAATLGRQGIPIFIYPYAGAGPQVGIAAADLPAQVEAGATTYVRGVLHNWSATPADLGVMLTRNTGQIEVDGRFGATATVGPVDSSLAPNASDLLRVGVTFEGRGLQFVDVAVNSADGEQRRRFFTIVSSPPRILAIGGDNGWLAALPPGAADIVQMGAEAFDPATALVGVDAVVISGVFAQQFKPGALATLAEAVQTDGLGLLLFNGRHPTPADETSATVIMSYADTPLGPLLPVTGGLREAEPPARQVAIIIDSSGSMAGEPLDKAKQITHYIIANLLRPQDRLTLISFTTDYKRYTDDLPMDAEGKQAALQALEGIEAKGGTEPSRALEALAGKRLENCGLIFLSDGGFSEGSWVTNRPDCRATVFAIGYAASPAPNEPIAILADPIPVGGNFDPANVSILYFDPHRKSWETASVPPRAGG